MLVIASLDSEIGMVGSSEEEDSTIIGAVLGPASWNVTKIDLHKYEAMVKSDDEW